jgi:C4-dicarboxylate-specific signal transduction histidine kinase
LAVNPGDLPFFLTFVACEVGVTHLISWRRKSEDALRHARDELEIRVAERTSALKNANDAMVLQMAEQKRTEETLQATRTELARVARITTIGELTASIAHEVNQPLAAVVANADACVAWLSREQPDLVEARAAAERATQGATRRRQKNRVCKSIRWSNRRLLWPRGKHPKIMSQSSFNSRLMCRTCWATVFSCSK